MNYYVLLLFVLSYQTGNLAAPTNPASCIEHNLFTGMVKLLCGQIDILDWHSIRAFSFSKSFIATDLNIAMLAFRPFRRFFSVMSISLSDNKIKIIPNYVFDDCKKLKIVHLYNNQIHTIAPHAFHTLNQRDQFHLNGIILSKNQLEELPFESFEQCCFITIDFLDISDNPKLNVSTSDIFEHFICLPQDQLAIGHDEDIELPYPIV